MMTNLLVAIDPAALGPRPGKTGWAVFENGRLKGSGSCRGNCTAEVWMAPDGPFELVGIDPRRLVVEEPGGWIRGFRRGGGKAISYDSIRALERAIGAWQAIGAETVTDEHVKEALTGNCHAPKYQVHQNLRLMGYDLATGRCPNCRSMNRMQSDHDPDAADAVALGHVVSSEAAQLQQAITKLGKA
jgi:hypothetical protein